MPALPALPRRTLGRTGLDVTVLGVGGWLGVLDDPEAGRSARESAAVQAVQRAVELGIDYFDTSPSYGDAERHLGLGLAALTRQQRAGLRLSTKVGTHPQRSQDYGRDAVRWSVERSLQVLAVERLDIVHVHDPSSDARMDEILASGGAVDALDELRQEGVVGAIGLGVRVHRYLRVAIRSGRFDVILPSYDYHPVRRSLDPLLQEAFSRGVGVINGSPYNAGLLAGLEPEAANRRRGVPAQDVLRARRLWDWCRARHLDLGALAMQFSLRDERIATTLAGPRTAREVEGNVRHATEPLAPETWDELSCFLQELGPEPPGGDAL